MINWQDRISLDPKILAGKALLLNSKSASTWITKGYILKELGHKEEADVAFAKAREIEHQG